jgi:hypothetical protein
MESHDSADKLIKNLESSEIDFSKLLQQSNQLDAILLKLMRCAKFDANKPSSGTLNSPKIDATDFSQPALLHDAPYIGGKSS